MARNWMIWEQIDRAANLTYRPARRNLPGPTDQKRRAQSPFVDTPLLAFHAAIPSKAVGPVVGEVDHDSLFAEPKGIQLLQDPADIPINIFTHCEGGPSRGKIFLFAVTIPLRRVEPIEFSVEFVINVKRRMRRIEGNITEEGLLAIFLNEMNRVVNEIIGEVSLALYLLPVVIKRRAEVMPPMP